MWGWRGDGEREASYTVTHYICTEDRCCHAFIIQELFYTSPFNIRTYIATSLNMRRRRKTWRGCGLCFLLVEVGRTAALSARPFSWKSRL